MKRLLTFSSSFTSDVRSLLLIMAIYFKVHKRMCEFSPFCTTANVLQSDIFVDFSLIRFAIMRKPYLKGNNLHWHRPPFLSEDHSLKMNLLCFCYILLSVPIALATSETISEEEVKSDNPASDVLMRALLGEDEWTSDRQGRSNPINEDSPNTEESWDTSADESTVEETLIVGSVRGVPGQHFPDYTDIPISSFSCDDKTTQMPGFYADMETGCQVFHVCYEQRRESFLCPVGTIFNQAILTCDMWYNSNCSTSPNFYSVVKTAEDHQEFEEEEFSPVVSSMGDVNDTTRSLDETVQEFTSKKGSSKDKEVRPPSLTAEEYWDHFMKFFPVKARVVVYPGESSNGKIVAEASVGDRKEQLEPRTNPSTHRPIFPPKPDYPTTHLHYPTTHRPHYPTTHRPHYPTTHRPHYPTTHRPHYPTTHKPHYPTTHRPHYPTTHRPHYPTTHKPHYPTTHRPHYPTTHRPHYPTTHRPHYPTTHKPHYPTAHRPHYPKPHYPKPHKPHYPPRRPHYPPRRPHYPPRRPHYPPHRPGYPKSYRPGSHIDPHVHHTIDDALNTARRILEQVADMMPHRSLTQINPRFNYKTRMQ